MDYQSALSYITSFGRFGSRPGLERMQWVLERIGHPEASQRFIHIAGTNGKGSTTALVHNVLQAAGYRVGMYTSPYLEAFTNRIGVGGKDIDTDALISLVERLRPHFEAVNQSSLGPITQFEVTTLLALAYYQELGLDFIVWEVGLGGRMDATNVVTPAVSVITNIGRDHTEVLGDTLAQIAAEKAGIVKAGIPVVTAVNDQEALAVIEDVAANAAAPLMRLGQEYFYVRNWFSLEEQSFDYQDPSMQLADLRIQLMGAHQCQNAATALAVISQLRRQGFKIDEQACRDGLESTCWPGRLEVMQRQPLIIVDGAHNPHGTLALRQALRDYFPGRQIAMVLGILQDKERAEMLGHLLPLATRVIFAAPNFGRATDPQLLLQEAALQQVPARAAASVAEAIDIALAELAADEILLVAGSLYIVSEARDHLKNKE